MKDPNYENTFYQVIINRNIKYQNGYSNSCKTLYIKCKQKVPIARDLPNHKNFIKKIYSLQKYKLF